MGKGKWMPVEPSDVCFSCWQRVFGHIKMGQGAWVSLERKGLYRGCTTGTFGGASVVRSVTAMVLCLFTYMAGFEELLNAQRLLPLAWELQDSVPAPDLTSLRIVVVAGEDGVNIVKKKTAVQPVVEVRDRNNTPVSGIIINFTTPNGSPSAVFSPGTRTLSLVTDSTGRATVSGMQPVGTGPFRINVKASSGGAVLATAVIAQTNFATVAAAAGAGAATTGAAAGGLSTGLIVGIVVGVAAAAAIGGVLATHGGGGGGSTTPTATIGVGAGAGTVGPPH